MSLAKYSDTLYYLPHSVLLLVIVDATYDHVAEDESLGVHHSLSHAVRDLVALASLVKMATTVPEKERTREKSSQINSTPLTGTGSTTAVADDIDDVDDVDDDVMSCRTITTTFTSVASSIWLHDYKYGRRYHHYYSGSYNFPNDNSEQERLDIIHHICVRLLDGRLFLAPVEHLKLARVLDIGTGTGVWALDFADEFPSAEIVGNDLSPIQPDWVPPNVQFIVDNTELDWVEPHRYDFIHSRHLAGSIRNWPNLMRQIYENLYPGGWVELQEFTNILYSTDGALEEDNPLALMIGGLAAACEKIERTFRPTPFLKGWVEEAGFINVEQQTMQVPIGSWPKDPKLKEIGTWMSYSFVKGFDALTAVLFRDVLGWHREELGALEEKVKQAAQQSHAHIYMSFNILTGQRPF